MTTKLDQLTSWLKERKITEVECMISDLTGIARGKISPTNKFLDEKGVFLPDSFRPDNLHPAAKGYDIWGQAVSAKLAELTK